MLPFIMLVEIVLEIGLFMYQLLRSNKPVRSLLSLAVMAVMIPLLFSVSQADPDNIGDAFLLDAPWLIFAAAISLRQFTLPLLCRGNTAVKERALAVLH